MNTCPRIFLQLFRVNSLREHVTIITAMDTDTTYYNYHETSVILGTLALYGIYIEYARVTTLLIRETNDYMYKH